MLGQSFVGHFLSLCSIFIFVHPVDRTNFELKVFWVGLCTPPSTGSPVWPQEVAISVSIFPADW